ncbi:Pleckstriny domain-containing family M member [Echinococcus granulosus]|uniref:Pleckstriny domain-containing family M member n=1 Tax=Echinococcus granulosus TaxID=6210 RepID=W6V8M1_ECHGR|nr:Pleckstriny domain-containing family M member [Echinococcus granulosus]EUB62884.1 Pleckstriny domain-containing family M member [Echinococcus granulosus]
MSDSLQAVQTTWVNGACFGWPNGNDPDSEPELSDAVQLQAESRYYLHHHHPVVKASPSVSHHGDLDGVPKRKKKKDERVVERPGGLRLVKSAVDLMRHSVTHSGRNKHPKGEGERLSSGHLMIPASSTKYWGACEACRQNVHLTKYLYCRHCPVVCHASNRCLSKLKRKCPSVELGILGWGEGKAAPKKLVHFIIDLEDVYLGGSLSGQSNTCAECGRVLIAEMGYSCGQTAKSELEMEQAKVEATAHPAAAKPIKRLRQGLRTLLHGKSNGAGAQVQECAKKVLVCHFTKKRYCERCHWGDEWYIPANMLLLNDYAKHPASFYLSPTAFSSYLFQTPRLVELRAICDHPRNAKRGYSVVSDSLLNKSALWFRLVTVSRSAYLLLRVLWDTAVLHVPPEWYKENVQAAQVLQIRKKFKAMSHYFHACPLAHTVRELVDGIRAPHLTECASLLRMVDVIQIVDNSLYEKLERMVHFLEFHITNCRICKSENRKCCVCGKGKRLFYHDNDVCLCHNCGLPYHA